MVAFSLQTLLLMAAAYFVGCVVACVVRRSLFRPAHQTVVERRVDPLPEVLARGDSVRFGETAAAKVQPPVAAPVQPPVQSPTPPPARAAVDKPPAPAPVVARPAERPAPAVAELSIPAAVVAPAAVAAAVEPPLPAVAALSRAPAPAQDLKRIRLIDPRTEATLNELGVTRYEQIAAWTRDDVRRIGEKLGAKGRINLENWIEQAAILAKGGETYYSARRARGETATAAPTADRGQSAPAQDQSAWPRAMSHGGVAATVVAAPPPVVSERAAFAAAAAPSPAAAVPIRPAAAARDNLQRIGHIAPEVEQALNADGITRYAQIAQWSPGDVERFEKKLRADGRISRENWIEQAQILSRGGDTRFSREFDAGSGGSQAPSSAASAARRSELGALRSVRSPALRDAGASADAADRAGGYNKGPRGSDDLKRIRGIGVLIEKKLNAMGVTSYEHIANWAAADIDRVSRSLDFKGRIERENWVEQARILSAGGHTEFSRRVDRGEVETSRAKT